MAAEVPMAVYQEPILTGRRPDNTLDPAIAGLDRITTQDWVVGRHQGFISMEYGHLYTTGGVGIDPSLPTVRSLIIARFFRNSIIDLDQLVVHGEIRNEFGGSHEWAYNKNDFSWIPFTLDGSLGSWFGASAGKFVLNISDVVNNWISVRLTLTVTPANDSSPTSSEDGVRIFSAGAWLENSTLPVIG